MSTQIMGSQGGVRNPSVSKPLSLSRQVSLYSLTLDEVENQLANAGKPLSSMNLDELLRNVWTVEEANQSLGTGNGDNGAQNLAKHESSFSLSRDLSRKTVDEVLREINQGKKSGTSILERQDTLGEMTLEDFLVQAGVVLDNNDNGNIDRDDSGVLEPSNAVEHAHWMQYPLLPQQQQPSMMTMFMPTHHNGGAMSDSSYPEPQMMCDTQTAGRKRVAPGIVVEKTVERRQKRMIKNRESAARSRARKQAYTNELENKVSRLEEENERLRRMMEAEKALPSVPPAQPKFQLRRTSSATF